ncbi:hypothetical protein [Alicyclobacillus pomorum]|jgi:hypothetical protein|uniref:hypothetical protein n=1 Tax=Alicyclobacillus pomorum TaxID=204470 RepID=UPI00047A5864|nr:hypothetical protein [Alicyclobacillus pomorum]
MIVAFDVLVFVCILVMVGLQFRERMTRARKALLLGTFVVSASALFNAAYISVGGKVWSLSQVACGAIGFVVILYSMWASVRDM